MSTTFNIVGAYFCSEPCGPKQSLDVENKSVMGAQLNQVSGPLKEIKLSPERGHLMRGRLADSDEWRVTLERV